jgi:hypothetical protein
MSKKANEATAPEGLPTKIGAAIIGMFNKPISDNEISKTLEKAREVSAKAKDSLERASRADKNYEDLERKLSMSS